MSFDPEKVYPSVSVGVGTGQFVEHFDVDMDAIRNHLVEGGMSDEQIGRVSILFSDQVSPREPRTGRSFNRQVGNFNRITNQINVWPIEEIAASKFVGLEAIDQAVSKQVGETLVHELEHAVANNDPRQHRINHLFRAKEGAKIMGLYMFTYFEISNLPILDKPIMTIAGIAIGGLAANIIAAHPRYKNRLYRRNPEEKRCRQAELEAPKDIVTIRSKEDGNSIANLLKEIKEDDIVEQINAAVLKSVNNKNLD